MGNTTKEEHLHRIDIELETGNHGGALVMVEEIQLQWPDDQQILQRAALCHYGLDRKALAIQSQRELVARFPESQEAASRLIAWSIQAGDTSTIRPLLDYWRARLPDNPWFWLNEIRAFHLMGQQEKELSELRRFVQRRPGIEEGWRMLLRAEFKAGDNGLFDAAVKGALVAFPDSLGMARVALDVSLAAWNFELALLAHDSLVRINPAFDANEPRLSCRFQLLRIVRRYRGGEEEAAIEEIRALIGRFPDDPAPVRQYCRWLNHRARLPEGSSLVVKWRDRLPRDSDFILWEIRLLREKGDITRAWALCDELINKQPLLEAAWVERLLLTQHESLSHLWHETAIQAAAVCPCEPSIVAAIYNSTADRGDLAFTSKTLQTFLEACPDVLRGYQHHLAASFYNDQAQYSKALYEIDAGLSKFPNDYRLLLLRLPETRALEQDGALLSTWAQEVLEHAQIDQGGVHRAAWILLDMGKNELLGKLLRDITQNSRLNSAARLAAEGLISLYLGHEEASSSGDVRKSGGTVILRLPPRVRHVVFVFGGVADCAATSFELLTPVFDKFGFGAISLIDRQKLLFLNGVEELADSYENTLKALHDLLPDSVTTISCLGNSAGGYAALRYAIDLNATSALLFASPTNLDADACTRDGRARIVARRIHKVTPHRAVNLAPVLAHSSHKPNVHLWYGGAMRQDREHAMYLAGVPGVSLHEVPGYKGHDVIWHLASSGRLEEAVRQAMIEVD